MTRYMTREGFLVIKAEMDHLWSVERPAVVKEVTEAAELGDRSENAAYIYGKRRLRQIDSRVQYLRKKLEGVTVVDLADQPGRKNIMFGAVVVVEDEDGQQHTWRLVDQDESDPARGRISVQSPIGRSLLGKTVGDAVTVQRPKGTMDLEILEIRYGAGGP